MRFLPLPRGTVPTVIISIILLLAWLVWGTLTHPEALWAPGDLSRFHADISACGGCHQPFKGTTTDKCVSCHDDRHFAAGSKPDVSGFHRKSIREGTSCTGCHTEHRGTLAQITVGAMINPHGEFIFRATNTYSCTACHDFNGDNKSRSFFLDNPIVRHLMEKGEGAHRPGKMVNCLMCHTGGRLEIEGDDDD